MPARTANPFTTVRTEGALLPPELLQRVAQGDTELKGFRPQDYGLAESERLGEAISRSWNRLTGVWAAFAPALDGFGEEDPGTGPTREKWLGPLFQELAFGKLQTAKAVEIEGTSYPVSHSWANIPIHLVGAGLDLDRRSPGVPGAARTSPHSLLQEFLNRSSESLWGVVSNGRKLRVLRDNVSLTRQAFLEFDLESMFAGEIYSDFSLLWLMCHQSRFEGERREESWLERWSQAAQQQGTRALDTLRTGVEEAVRSLGTGFLAHPGNSALRAKLRSGGLTTTDFYRQLLRLVYRLMFLFVAEDRLLLHPPDAQEDARRIYDDYYSTARLRSLAERRRGGKHPDLYETLKLVAKKLGDDEGAPTLGLPALGSFLWSQEALSDLDQGRLANQFLLQAVRSLAFTTQGKVLRAIDYRNMGSEELGSIYESLLELHPEIHQESATFELGIAAGHERKTTGSYYTPVSLISALLDSALDPVLEEAADKADSGKAILDLKVLDPACGSGHFLVAAAHRIAKRLATVRTGDEEASPEAYRTALRDVIGRCVYGIDMNPMAVELCKVSLWMEAVEPGKPLSFLEHHILCGNSLLGATPRLLADGIPDEAFRPLEGDERSVVSELKRRNREERKGQQVLAIGASIAELTKPLVAGVGAIEETGDDSAKFLREKERLWARLIQSDEVSRASFLADAWCAAFVIPKRAGEPVLTEGVFRLLSSDPTGGGERLHDSVADIARRNRFLHPHLAFPTVFHVQDDPSGEGSGWDGGFDLVLGNPPWERVKLQEKEWFAVRNPAIGGAKNAAERKQLIEALPDEDPALYRQWKDAVRQAEGESHILRDSGRFPLGGRGDVNTYAVFAELMRDLTSDTGRTGCILPTGIATDDTTKHLFRVFVEERAVASLFSFENEEFIFPSIHHATRFCLLTLSGSARPVEEGEYVFFARQPSQILDAERRFTLTADDFALLNPNTQTCPVFRSRRDAELTKQVYRRVPILIREGPPELNPWGISFMRMFDMANDSGLFGTRQQLESEGWNLHGNVFVRNDRRHLPLYEAKMLHLFDHRFGTYEGQTQAQANQGKLPELSDEDHADVYHLPEPAYWVPEEEVTNRLSDRWGQDWLIGWRRITGATVVRTVIAAALPKTAVGDSIFLALPKHSSENYALLASLCSYVLDYVCRQKLNGINLNYYIFRQLPIPDRHEYGKPTPWEVSKTLGEWICPRVLELTVTASDMASFGQALGWEGPPFIWQPERRELLRAELDAAFMHIYGVGRNDADYILNTFRVQRDREERTYGEFRTKRLIVERFEEMARAVNSGASYQTPLDPPPADPQLGHSVPRGQ